MIPDSDHYAAWCRAERTALSGSPSIPALPERQALLLRCLTVLDRGDRGEIASLRDELTQHGDLARILDMALTPSDELKPLALHRAVKRSHATARGGLPIADLVKMAAQHRSGSRPRGSKALKLLVNKRPVLANAMALFHGDGPWLLCAPQQATRLRRADGITLLTVALNTPDPAATLNRVHPWVPDQVDLSHYPGWRRGNDDELLDRWLKADSPAEWGEDLDHAIDRQLKAPSKLRRRILGGLLDRIDLELRAGRAVGTLPVVRAATRLTAKDHPLVDLRRQLIRLANRLTLVTSQPDAAATALDALWDMSEGLSAAERTEIAGRLIEAQHRGSQRTITQVMLFTIGQGTDWDRRMLTVEATAHSMPRHVLEQALHHEPDPARRAAVCAVHALHSGQTQAAVAAIPRILSSPELTSQAVDIFSQCALAQPGGRSFRPGLAWQQTADALGRANLELEDLPGLIQALSLLEKQGEPLLVPIRAAAARALAKSSAGTPRVLALHIIIHDLLGASDAVRTHLRTIGRQLRMLPAVAADDLALRTIAMVYNDHPDEPDPALVAPLTRFLLREGPDRAKAAAQRLPVDEFFGEAVSRWSEANQDDLGKLDFWLSFQEKYLYGPERFWCPDCQAWHDSDLPL